MQANNQSLIVRLPNWVGDTLMALPSLIALQQSGFELHLYGRGWAADLLQGFPATVEVLPKPFKSAVKTLRACPAKNMLLLPNSLSSALSPRFAGKKSVGYATDGRQLLLQKSLQKKSGLHESDYFWEISEIAAKHFNSDVKWPIQKPKMQLPLTDATIAAVKKLLSDRKIGSSFVVLCPMATGVGKQGQPKIWPYWRQLEAQLHQQGVVTVACPGPGELQQCSELLPNSIILDDLSLSQYAAVCSLANFIIANDSGPMHLAASVNDKTLGIFGVTNPDQTRALRGNYIGGANDWPDVEAVLNYLNLTVHTANR